MRYYDPMVGQVDTEQVSVVKRDFSEKERKHLASTGAAMSDGSYPITDGADLDHAIELAGMGSKPKDEIKAHIKTRAKALGLEHKIPDTWKDGAKKADMSGVSGDEDRQPNGIDPDGLAPDAEQITFKPVPYTDIMRARHPQARLQTPGQFQPVSGKVVQPQDVPDAKIAPTPGLAK